MPRTKTKYSQVSSPKKREESDSITIRIQEKDHPVRIRIGPGTDFAHIDGKYLGKGVFEVDEIKEGVGSKSGWGHLTNEAGWVALDFVTIL